MSRMVRCVRVAKRALVFTGVLFFTSLLMKELTNSILPPMPGAPIRPHQRRSLRMPRPDQTNAVMFEEDVSERTPNESEGLQDVVLVAKGDRLVEQMEQMDMDEDVADIEGDLEGGIGIVNVSQEAGDVNQTLETVGETDEGKHSVGYQQDESYGADDGEMQGEQNVAYGMEGAQGGTYGAQAGAYGAQDGLYGMQSGTIGAQAGEHREQGGTNGAQGGAYGAQGGAYGAQAGAYGAQNGAYGDQDVAYGAPGGPSMDEMKEVDTGSMSSGGVHGGPGGVAHGENNFYIVYVTNTATAESIYIQPSGDLFKFKIKACSDAYLLFQQKLAASDKFSYHIGFGYGTKTVIWKKPPDPITQEFRTPKGGRMDCERTVSYWVNKVGPTFSIGFGKNEKPYIEWTDKSNPYDTNALTLVNPWPKKEAVWFLNMDTVKILRVDTGKEYSYEQVWLTTLGKGSVVLQVRACRDVHVLLSDKFGAVGNVYEVAIGIRENQLTTMREEKFGPNVAAAETQGILDCNEFKAFWLQWTAGKLQVGRGTKVGARKVLDHTKVNHPRRIKSIALSTGWGATGRWLFNMDQEHLFPT